LACPEPTSLLDIYPTLIELCELPKSDHTEGISLIPQLTDPSSSRNQAAVTSSYFGNHSIRSRDWRLIVYEDGAMELYDHRSDPDEFSNLTTDPAYQLTIIELSRCLPTEATLKFKQNSERKRSIR